MYKLIEFIDNERHISLHLEEEGIPRAGKSCNQMEYGIRNHIILQLIIICFSVKIYVYNIHTLSSYICILSRKYSKLKELYHEFGFSLDHTTLLNLPSALENL